MNGWTKPPRNRRIGIIGAGPGGISAAYRLKQAGYDNIVIWEKTDGVGGTWHINRYPGLACDVASHLYSFSFDLNPRWSRAFATQPEILDYMQGVAARQDINRHVKLSTEVVAAHWDDECAKWWITFASGEHDCVDILVSAQGMFNIPKWPNVPGGDDFEGILFHTARWRDDVSLEGKRVAVIGSAATSVQMVPVIAESVAKLDVYQRTPTWVLPKEDPVVDQETLARREADPGLVRQERLRLYRDLDQFVRWTERTDDSEFRELCVGNIAVVEDPKTRAELTPDFNWGCARPLFSNDFYPAFNRDNVELIVTPIERFSKTGIVDQSGEEREYDVIICATGYHVDKFLSAIEVTGRNGLKITDAWKDGAHAYLGIVTAGFPNLFMSYGPNTNNGSLIFMAECEAAYMVRHIRWMDANDIGWIDIKPIEEAKYNEEVQRNIGKAVLWNKTCSSYYFGKNGQNITQCPLNMTEYRDAIMTPDWDKFEVHYGDPL